MGELDKEVFYVLQEEVVKKADKLCGGLNREFEYTFYGYDSGVNDPKSIANVVHDSLIKEGYHFNHFHFIGDTKSNEKKYVFNGAALRKAKGKYNRVGTRKTVEFEKMYIDAFLAFLGKSIEDLKLLAKEYDIKEEIDHTNSGKPKRKETPKRRELDEQQEEKFNIVDKHFNSDFYLYSYNEKRLQVYRAVLEIRPTGTHFEVLLKNKNDKGFPYTGILDYKLIDEYIVIITLYTRLRNKRLYILLSVNLNLQIQAIIYQGQMLRFGKETDPVSSDTFIERIAIGTGEPKIYKTDDLDLPEHVRVFFDPPVYNKTDKKQFRDIESFMKWAKKKKNP